MADGVVEQDGATQADPGLATNDVSVTDSAADAVDASGLDSDGADPGATDIAADAGAETGGEAIDVAADIVPDAAAETTVDAATDAAPDAKPDAAADAAADVAADTATDAKPDAAADATADVAADTAPDAKPDSAPDSSVDTGADADAADGADAAAAADAASLCVDKACDDGDACTKDSCDTKTGLCVHEQTCAAQQPLPYKMEFPCGAKPVGWTWADAPGSGTSAAWAVDATPASPGPLTAGCTLNFNNGQDFSCTTPVKGSALSPWVDASKVAAKPGIELSFALAGSWEPNEYDNFEVYATSHGKAWTLLAALDGPGSKWKTLTYDLSAFAGGPVLVWFEFWTKDCYSNAGTGPFIDSFSIAAKAGCAVTGCDDGNACTKDTCSTTTGACSFQAAPLGTPCDDGNPCTVSDSCSASACQPGTAKSCDDANACTVDACDAKTGVCSHVANPLCGGKGKSLPFASSFDCASPGLADWQATGTPGGPSWAFDADGSTFEFPGYQSPSCSANFNNGLDYQCPATGVKQVSGALTSPSLDGTAVKPGQLVYLDLWLAGKFNFEDELVLETTVDGDTWKAVRTYPSSQISATKWKLFVDPLEGVAGKTFAWRLRFTSAECIFNNKPGVFVDDVKVYASAPCDQSDAWAKQEFDPYGGYNVGTFTMGLSASLNLDPKVPVTAGATKLVYWYVYDSSTNKMAVDVTYSAAGPVDVCVQHQCYKSKAYACTVNCPAGTTKTVAGDGCCLKGQASGEIAFTPLGNGITAGYTKV